VLELKSAWLHPPTAARAQSLAVRFVRDVLHPLDHPAIKLLHFMHVKAISPLGHSPMPDGSVGGTGTILQRAMRARVSDRRVVD
jgi:hypothetical protein